MIDEQEIIEEILTDYYKRTEPFIEIECKECAGLDFLCNNHFEFAFKVAIHKAIQKGKELGANECILEGKPDKGHPIPVYCPACFDESIEKQASKIAELEKEYLHALECMDRICKRCQDNLERLRR